MKRKAYQASTAMSLAILFCGVAQGNVYAARIRETRSDKVSAATVSEYYPLDKRVTDSSVFSQIFARDQWQYGGQVSDNMQQHSGCVTGISNTPGGWEARRAQNLAASGHYAEAIGEWTRAIDNYDVDKSKLYGRSLDANWLISRARLYLKIAKTDEAIADLERAARLKGPLGEATFSAAVIFTSLGKYEKAHALLTDIDLNATLPMFRPYFEYLLALTQQMQGKDNLAKPNYLAAANHFAAAANTPACTACLDSLNQIDKPKGSTKPEITIADLSPPSSNYANIKKLFVALATRDDIFDMAKFKDLVGATTIKEVNTAYLVIPFMGHYKELSLVAINKQPGGGLKLMLHTQPVLCSINKAALKDVLPRPSREEPNASESIGKAITNTETYKVPSGTLVLNTINGGFNSIKSATLYSKDATYPEVRVPCVQKADTALQKAHTRARATDLVYRGDIKLAEPIANEWLKEEPENPRAHLLQAEIYFKKGQLDQALSSIDIAIKFGPNDELLIDKHTGNFLRLRKATYQLEKGLYTDAYDGFNAGFGQYHNPDQLVLRARAEIGLHKLTEARTDLNNAAKAYFEAGRIVKRDEVQKLLDSINGSKN